MLAISLFLSSLLNRHSVFFSYHSLLAMLPALIVDSGIIKVMVCVLHYVHN